MVETVNTSLLERANGEGNGTPLQYSCLENPWTEEPGRLQSMGSLRVGFGGLSSGSTTSAGSSGSHSSGGASELLPAPQPSLSSAPKSPEPVPAPLGGL